MGVETSLDWATSAGPLETCQAKSQGGIIQSWKMTHKAWDKCYHVD